MSGEISNRLIKLYLTDQLSDKESADLARSLDWSLKLRDQIADMDIAEFVDSDLHYRAFLRSKAANALEEAIPACAPSLAPRVSRLLRYILESATKIIDFPDMVMINATARGSGTPQSTPKLEVLPGSITRFEIGIETEQIDVFVKTLSPFALAVLLVPNDNYRATIVECVAGSARLPFGSFFSISPGEYVVVAEALETAE
jgi:hypothetical protein